MSDWQPGDLALCVRQRSGFFPGQVCTSVRLGAVNTVTRVGRPLAAFGGLRGLALAEATPHRPGRGFLESLFVRISPLTDAEREEALRDLKAPVREPVQ